MSAKTGKHILLEAFKWTPVLIALNGALGQIVRVEGKSMQPTLNPPRASSSDYLVLNKLPRQYKPGDIVVLGDPFESISTTSSSYLIKRIIATERDWIKDTNGNYREIPSGMCWIEGDGPSDISEDSRDFGPVSMALIQGRAMGIFWPPHRIQSLPSIVPPSSAGRVHVFN